MQFFSTNFTSLLFIFTGKNIHQTQRSSFLASYFFFLISFSPINSFSWTISIPFICLHIVFPKLILIYMGYPNVPHILNGLELCSFKLVIIIDKELPLLLPLPSTNECNAFGKGWVLQCGLGGRRKTSVHVCRCTNRFAFAFMCTHR